MIYVHDQGRMANNILQYGHVYAWGRAHGQPTVSMRFAYKYPYFHICHTPRHNFPTYVFAKYAAKWGFIPTLRFNEEQADYSRHEQLMASGRTLVVTGWYARWYDLFLDYLNEIRELFAFLPEVTRRVDAIFASPLAPNDSTAALAPDGFPVGSENTPLRLGLHIRRGDYATFYDGRFLYTDEQYVAVVRRFLLLHPGRRVMVYICGNDPHLNRSYYHSQLPECTVIFPDGNPGEDLCLLSRCHYLIGAPSTFTLVAAMYHDLPLYWIEHPDAPLTSASFHHFSHLFRNIY